MTIDDFRVSNTQNIPASKASESKIVAITKLHRLGKSIDEITRATWQGKWVEPGDAPMVSNEQDYTGHYYACQKIARYREVVRGIVEGIDLAQA